MITGGRHSREAEQQAEWLRENSKAYAPYMPALARIIMGSRMFQRLMERLDTREGIRRKVRPSASRQDSCVRVIRSCPRKARSDPSCVFLAA